MAIPGFLPLVESARKKRNLPQIPKDFNILAVDPGHTTGLAKFDAQGTLLSVDQINTRGLADGHEIHTTLQDLIYNWANVIVLEEYRVYAWRAKHHTGSDLLTARVIGSIETMVALTRPPNSDRDITIVKQPASVAKAFCSDNKLRKWQYYVPGKRHARDAVRHGCYWFLFGSHIPIEGKRGGQVVG